MSRLPELSPSLALISHFGLTNQEAQTRYEAVIKKGIPFLTAASQIPGLESDNRKAAIIGGGPTLKEEILSGVTIIDQLNARDDLLKVIVGSTHGSLNRFQGVQLAVIGLADKNMLPAYQNVSSSITYIVAAQADPEIFEHLVNAGATVLAYDAYIPGVAERADSVAPGSTAATAAAAVLAGILGKKNIECFGVDGSTTKRGDLTVPAYAFDEIAPTDEAIQKALAHPVPFPIAGSTLVQTPAGVFEVSDNMRPQLEEFYKLTLGNPDIDIHFHGSSAHAALCNKPVASSPTITKNRKLTP